MPLPFTPFRKTRMASVLLRLTTKNRLESKYQMKQAGGTSSRRSEPEGRYADRFKIGYRSSVFVLDFEQSFFEDDEDRVHTRIITSPEYAKAFLELLQESIGQYERNHGPILREAGINPSVRDNDESSSDF